MLFENGNCVKGQMDFLKFLKGTYLPLILYISFIISLKLFFQLPIEIFSFLLHFVLVILMR